ncbi:CPXCG motif-containing cysteine-rich protein [Candidatus Gottesmanbacteria bacterium]|nr:CPXCG motif-containing cysteine-rich protein [Candidatus Gottesmanbacteria bacterium]
MKEHFFVCPYCGKQISMLLDSAAKRYKYIEDCEICCNPIEISFSVEASSITHFSAECIEQ